MHRGVRADDVVKRQEMIEAHLINGLPVLANGSVIRAEIELREDRAYLHGPDFFLV